MFYIIRVVEQKNPQKAVSGLFSIHFLMLGVARTAKVNSAKTPDSDPRSASNRAQSECAP